MKKGGFIAGILFSAVVGGAAYIAYKLYKKKEAEKLEDEAFARAEAVMMSVY